MNGANGETYDEMRSTLQFAHLSNEEINKSYKSLIEALYASDPKVIFQSANSIWYRDEITFEQPFFDLSIKYFNALVSELNFNDPVSFEIINNWVNQNTNGKIEKILDSIPPDAVMYLINAIYFNGTWKFEFDKEETKVDEFNLLNGEKIDTDMMVQTNDFNYYINEDLQAIELPYGDGNFSMVILLPNEDSDINEFANGINEEKLNSWLAGLTLQQGTLWLPKFKVEYNSELKDYLELMGMVTAYNPLKADFSNMYKGPEKLFISRVFHKTFVEVDEEGTEAAAVTLVEIEITSAGEGNNFNIKVNRPFVFIIKEKNSNCILFMGKIINPQS
jgi:serpin B